MKNVFVLIFCVITLSAFTQDFKLMADEKLYLTGYEDGLRTIWFSSDNTQICGDNKDLLRWNIQSGKLIQKTPIPGYSTYKSCINGDQSLWVQANVNYNDEQKKDIASTHSNLNIFSYAFDEMRSNKISGYHIKDHAFLPNRDNQLLVIVSLPNTYLYSLRIFSLEQMKDVTPITTTRSEKDLMICLAVSENGEKAVVGYAGENSRIEVYDLINFKLLESFKTDGEVHEVAIANGTAVGVGDKTVTVIDLNKTEKVKTIKTNEGCFALAISPNGKTVAIGDRYGSELVDLESGKLTPLYDGQCQSLCFDSKGNMVAVGVFKSMHLADIPSAFIFFNENKNEEVTITTTESDQNNDSSNSSSSWFSFTNKAPNFSVDLPVEPETKLGTSKSGIKQTQIKSIGKTNGVLINIAEATKIKPKNYYAKSKEVGAKFLENMGEDTDILKTEKTQVDGNDGTFYEFTKGSFKYYYKCALIDGYLYQLTFFTADQTSTDFQDFFASFKIN